MLCISSIKHFAYIVITLKMVMLLKSLLYSPKDDESKI